MATEQLTSEFLASQLLPQFGIVDAEVSPLRGGLINQSYNVATERNGERVDLILQRVNPIFPAAIHRNIHAVTVALKRAGLPTPQLVSTLDGRLCLDGQSGVWRLMNRIPGVTFDVVEGPEQAQAAGAAVGQFHAALATLDHVFVGGRIGVHDTARHLAHLDAVIRDFPQHRLFDDVAPLAKNIQAAARALPSLPSIPPRVGHGDLKFNNLVFAGALPPASRKAVCWIDLDTVGPVALAHELGDAWRSWCNRSGEDDPEAKLDLDIFAASWRGYEETIGRSLSQDERLALLLGPEWISLELSARFTADALAETYFGWSPDRFPGRAEHNLVRGRGQWSLFQAFRDSRAERARLLVA